MTNSGMIRIVEHNRVMADIYKTIKQLGEYQKQELRREIHEYLRDYRNNFFFRLFMYGIGEAFKPNLRANCHWVVSRDFAISRLKGLERPFTPKTKEATRLEYLYHILYLFEQAEKVSGEVYLTYDELKAIYNPVFD